MKTLSPTYVPAAEGVCALYARVRARVCVCDKLIIRRDNGRAGAGHEKVCAYCTTWILLKNATWMSTIHVHYNTTLGNVYGIKFVYTRSWQCNNVYATRIPRVSGIGKIKIKNTMNSRKRDNRNGVNETDHIGPGPTSVDNLQAFRRFILIWY